MFRPHPGHLMIQESQNYQRELKMGRKGKSSPAEDFIEIASKLPSWAGLFLAALSYFLLHAYATQQTNIVVAPGSIANSMVPAVLKGLATAGQYIMPILFGAAAILSWFRRSKSSPTQKISTSSKTAPANTGRFKSPSCPLCSSEMVRREAKRGANAGKAFWGCSKYPACKGSRGAD